MRNFEKILVLSAYLLLPLVPVYFYVQGTSEKLTLLVLISRVAGIYAFVWFALQFILTSRVRLIEKIAGQDRLVTAHMIAALAALLLVAFHTSFGGEEKGREVQKWFGGAGITVFLYVSAFSALFFSDYFMRFLPFLVPLRDRIAKVLKLSHERCLWVHNAMPIALVLVLVHVFLLRDQGLGVFKISMTLIAAAGLVLFAWRRLVAPSLRSRHPWKVAGVTQVSDSITTLAFEHPGGRRLRHHPGQFCYLFPLNDELPRESHPFTISSSPADPRPTVTVKNLGDFTAQVRALKPGDAVCLEGAYGRFSYQHVPENRELVFIAGGIGITPMLSMLRHISREDPKRKVTLVWGARNAEDLICREEFEIWSREMENFLFEPVLSRARQWEGRIGRIDKALLADVFENKNGQDGPVDRSTAEFFICGPPAMVRTVLHALTDLGFAARRIHTERFAF